MPIRESRPVRWIARRRSTLGTIAMFLAVIFAGYAAVVSYNQGQDIQAGRKVGSRLSCAVGASLTDGGVRFVEASAQQPQPPKLETFLHGYGFPTPEQRKANGMTAGKAYAKFISDSIVEQVGPQARGIVHKDGTFDCDKFAALARIPK